MNPAMNLENMFLDSSSHHELSASTWRFGELFGQAWFKCSQSRSGCRALEKENKDIPGWIVVSGTSLGCSFLRLTESVILTSTS